MNKFLQLIWELVKIGVIALVIVIPIRYFVFQPFVVRGASMEPNFQDFDYLIINEISYRFEVPQRGEVIVFNSPMTPSQRFIKRVIGLPGETVQIQQNEINITTPEKTITLNESSYLPASLVTSNSNAVTLGSDEYFVLGDNRPYSYDSRYFGPIKRNTIIGKVALKFSLGGAFAKNLFQAAQ
jgi:signal peptidase I